MNSCAYLYESSSESINKKEQPIKKKNNTKLTYMNFPLDLFKYNIKAKNGQLQYKTAPTRPFIIF